MSRIWDRISRFLAQLDSYEISSGLQLSVSYLRYNHAISTKVLKFIEQILTTALIRRLHLFSRRQFGIYRTAQFIIYFSKWRYFSESWRCNNLCSVSSALPFPGCSEYELASLSRWLTLISSTMLLK